MFTPLPSHLVSHFLFKKDLLSVFVKMQVKIGCSTLSFVNVSKIRPKFRRFVVYILVLQIRSYKEVIALVEKGPSGASLPFSVLEQAKVKYLADLLHSWCLPDLLGWRKNNSAIFLQYLRQLLLFSDFPYFPRYAANVWWSIKHQGNQDFALG